MNPNNLKFRAWDKQNKKFVYLSGIFNNKNKNLTDFSKWSGIKDSKNKKIYEGDIITTNGEVLRWVVSYDNTEILYGIGCISDNLPFPITKWLNQEYPKLIVVGNYRNKKLVDNWTQQSSQLMEKQKE